MRRLALILLVALVSCGGGEDNDRETGEGYSLELPAGWSDKKEEAKESVPVRFDTVFAKPPRGGFATNVNVIRVRSRTSPTFEAVSRQQRRELGAVGARTISPPKRSKLGGDDATERTYSVRTPQGVTVRGRQVVAHRGGRFFTVTFSSRSDYFRSDDREFQEILDSWEWD